MNAERRRQIGKIERLISEAKDQLDSVRADDQEALDRPPEGLRTSQQDQAMQEAIDALDSAFEDLESAEGDLAAARGGDP